MDGYYRYSHDMPSRTGFMTFLPARRASLPKARPLARAAALNEADPRGTACPEAGPADAFSLARSTDRSTIVRCDPLLSNLRCVAVPPNR